MCGGRPELCCPRRVGRLMSCQGMADVSGSGSLPVMLKLPVITSGERYEWRYSRWARSEARLRKRSCSPQRGQRKGRSQEVTVTAPQACPFLSKRKEPEPLEHNFCCITLHLEHKEKRGSAGSNTQSINQSINRQVIYIEL